MTKRLPKLDQQLAQLVALPSVSSLDPNWDMSNKAVCDLLAEWLRDLGFQVELLPLPQPGKYNLVATYGKGPGGLVLAGHTDTVPFDDSLWQSDPLKLTEQNGRWYGMGTADMKGFFPLILAAIEALDLTQLKQPLIILATADEESSMAGARALVEAGYPVARKAIIGEPTGLKPVSMHKGFYAYELSWLGQSGHSSDPSLGRNALDPLAELLTELHDFRGELAQQYQQPAFKVQVPTLNLGCIHGGDNPNRICGQCSLQFDFRPLPGMKVEPLIEQLQQRLTPIAERHGQRLSLDMLYPGVPPFSNAGQTELVQRAQQLSGHHPEAVAFATEAPFFTELGMETIVWGAGHIDQAHQPDEYVDQQASMQLVAWLRQMVIEYCLQPSVANEN